MAEHSFSSAQRLVSGATHCGADFSCKTKMATTLIFPCSSRVISLERVFALLQIGRTCCVVFSIAVVFQRKHQSQKIFFKISSIWQSELEWTRNRVREDSFSENNFSSCWVWPIIMAGCLVKQQFVEKMMKRTLQK